MPVKEIRLVGEGYLYTEVLRTQKRKGNLTVAPGFGPTAAFLNNRDNTSTERVDCALMNR